MGRTLLGVDLDESHVGGLVKRLLTDEELEKLADGGRPADDETDADLTDQGGSGPGETDEGSDASGDEFAGSNGGDGDPVDEAATETGDTATGTASTGSGSGSGSVGDHHWSGTETDDEDWLADEDDGLLGRFGEYQPIVLKGGAVVLVLVMLGLLVWRYGDRVKSALPVVGSGDGSVESDVTSAEPGEADADVSPARRRAKVGAHAEPEDEQTASGIGGMGADSGVEAVGEDVDVGALVGLGTLALIAALVRKFGEQRPRDPLVDGPEDEA